MRYPSVAKQKTVLPCQDNRSSAVRKGTRLPSSARKVSAAVRLRGGWAGRPRPSRGSCGAMPWRAVAIGRTWRMGAACCAASVPCWKRTGGWRPTSLIGSAKAGHLSRSPDGCGWAWSPVAGVLHRDDLLLDLSRRAEDRKTVALPHTPPCPVPAASRSSVSRYDRRQGPYFSANCRGRRPRDGGASGRRSHHLQTLPPGAGAPRAQDPDHPDDAARGQDCG
jgi:hypothetical protein